MLGAMIAAIGGTWQSGPVAGRPYASGRLGLDALLRALEADPKIDEIATAAQTTSLYAPVVPTAPPEGPELVKLKESRHELKGRMDSEPAWCVGSQSTVEIVVFCRGPEEVPGSGGITGSRCPG